MAIISSATNKLVSTNFSPREIGLKLWSAVHALFDPTIEGLRIDRSIKKFYERRDRKAATGVIVDIGILALEGFTCAKLGFKTAIPTIVVNNFAVVHLIRSFQLSSAPFNYKSAFPSSTAIQHIGLGLISGFVICSLNQLSSSKIMQIMQGLGFAVEAKQVAAILVDPSSMFGRLFSLWVCAVGPYVEEVVFRELLMNKMLESQKSEKNINLGKICIDLSKIKVLLKTSLIFGLYHAALSQKWTNLPIVAILSLVGMAFGALRLMTGNLWAPTVAHMVNNIILVASKYMVSTRLR